MKIKFLFLVMALIFIGIKADFASAEEQSLIVKPEKVSIEIHPGQKAKGKLTLYNKAIIPVKLKILKRDARLKDIEGKMEFYLNKESVSQWIEPEVLEIEIPPKAEKEINYSVYAPTYAKDRGYVGAIVFEAAEKQAVNIENVFGSTLLINVLKGDETEADISKVKVLDFSVPKFKTNNPIDLNLKIKNASENNLIAKASLAIKDWKNKTIEKAEIGNVPMLPESTHLFKWSWQKNKSKFGLYKTEITLDFSSKNQKAVTKGSWFLSVPFGDFQDIFKKYKSKLSLLKN